MRVGRIALVGGGCLGAVFAVALSGLVQQVRGETKELATAQPSSMGSPASAAGAASSGETAGTVVYTFPDDAKFDEFANLWRQYQAALTRKAVLETYLVQEEATMGKVNQELLSTFHLDVTKNYRLSPDRKTIIEVPAPAASQPENAPAASLVKPGTKDQPVQPQSPSDPPSCSAGPHPRLVGES